MPKINPKPTTPRPNITPEPQNPASLGALSLWRAYLEADAPYGRTTEGLVRWLREQADRVQQDTPADPRMQRPL